MQEPRPSTYRAHGRRLYNPSIPEYATHHGPRLKNGKGHVVGQDTQADAWISGCGGEIKSEKWPAPFGDRPGLRLRRFTDLEEICPTSTEFECGQKKRYGGATTLTAKARGWKAQTRERNLHGHDYLGGACRRSKA